MKTKHSINVWIFPALFLTTLSLLFLPAVQAQTPYSGRGISTGGPNVGAGYGAFNGYRRQQAAQPKSKITDALGELFGKPTFADNSGGPKFDLKLPKLDFLNKLRPSNNGGQNSTLGTLSKLTSLLSKRDPSNLSMLEKVKSKTDSFFDKAFVVQNLFQGNRDEKNTKWDDVRKTMENLARQNGGQDLVPYRASAPSGQIRR